MNGRSLVGLLCVALVVFPMQAWAQAEHSPPRGFSQFVGTWSLEQSAGTGRIAGLPVARTLVIATTPTHVSIGKDSAPPEVYRFDGTETNLGDGRRASFTLVAESLALTTRRTREQRGYSFTNVITDAYAVAGDVLTVERQLSVLVQPPGNLATLGNPNNNRQTIVYRRSQQAR